MAVTAVCGLSCRSLNPPLELFHAGARGRPRASGARPAPPGPYYMVHLAYTRPPPAFFVPATGTLRSYPDPFGIGDPVWLRLEAEVEAKLRAALNGLAPLPAPRLTTARVDGREVANPQPYLSLYGPLPRAQLAAGEGHARAIRLDGEEPNPWADGYNELVAFPGGLLRRDGDTVRLTPDLAELVQRPRFAPHDRPAATGPIVLALLGAALLAIPLRRLLRIS